MGFFKLFKQEVYIPKAGDFLYDKSLDTILFIDKIKDNHNWYYRVIDSEIAIKSGRLVSFDKKAKKSSKPLSDLTNQKPIKLNIDSFKTTKIKDKILTEDVRIISNILYRFELFSKTNEPVVITIHKGKCTRKIKPSETQYYWFAYPLVPFKFFMLVDTDKLTASVLKEGVSLTVEPPFEKVLIDARKFGKAISNPFKKRSQEHKVKKDFMKFVKQNINNKAEETALAGGHEDAGNDLFKSE